MGKLSVSHLQAKDIMAKPVVFFNAMTTVKEAIEALIKNKISGAPMIDPQSKKVISVVSEADLMKLAVMEGLNESLGFLAEQLPSTKDLVQVRPHSPFPEIFKQFLTHPVRRVLVINEDGTLAGVIARRDIIASFLESQN